MSNNTPTKLPMKGKIVLSYESIFKGEDILSKPAAFWHEFFLLKVNVNCLANLIDEKSPSSLLDIKDNVNELFYQSCKVLHEEHQIKIVNALQTLCVLMQHVLVKKFGDFGFDTINVIVGFEDAEQRMQNLVEMINVFLLGDYSISLKNLTLKLLLIIATALDNITQNAILEYLMMNSIFESLTQLLANPKSREEHGYECVLLLTLLINYRIQANSNPYALKLSILDNEMALNGFGLVMSDALIASNRKYASKKALEQPPTGLMSTLTSMVGTMLIGSGEANYSLSSWNDDVLLALYEAVHLNRNFFTVLSHVTPVDKSSTEGDHPDLVVERISAVEHNTSASDKLIPDASEANNLLVTFFTFCSIAMQDVKSENGATTAKLSLIILRCIVEDQFASAFLHDVNMAFAVPLHKMNLYHRKPVLEDPTSKPLAAVLLDVMVEFIVTHMMKSFPIGLYRRCVDIIHRVLCYEKRCRVRLHYPWTSLWTALMNLLKFILSHENHLVTKYNVFELAMKVVNIFNLFITFGDTFLPSPTSYDELYYETIRVRQIFDNLYAMGLRYSSSDSEWKHAASRMTASLVNVKAIINHFSPKIDSWTTSNHNTALTEDKVLDIIRANYDTLTLKLMESLDTYEKYTIRSEEEAFFMHLVRAMTSRIRHRIKVTDLQQLSVLREFSTIT